MLGLHLGLGVAVDRPRQLLQRSLHRRAQRLLDAAVDVLDEVGPLALHLVAVGAEGVVRLLHQTLHLGVHLAELLHHVTLVAALLLLEHLLRVQEGMGG